MQFEGFFLMVYIFIYFQFLAVLSPDAHGLSLVVMSRGYSSLLCMTFSCNLKVFLMLAKGKSCMRGKLLREMSAISLEKSFAITGFQ